jgi:hypothetical protein
MTQKQRYEKINSLTSKLIELEKEYNLIAHESNIERLNKEYSGKYFMLKKDDTIYHYYIKHVLDDRVFVANLVVLRTSIKGKYLTYRENVDINLPLFSLSKITVDDFINAKELFKQFANLL